MASTDALKSFFKTSRLVFRAPEDGDTDFMKNHIVGEPSNIILSSTRVPTPATDKAAQDYINLMRGNLLGVIICVPSSEPSPQGGEEKLQPVGCLSLFYLSGDAARHHHRFAELAISLAEDSRGKGYGTEAINWALDWAFRTVGLHRVSIAAFSYNTTAVNLYRKLGFVEEGRQREIIYHDRGWHDLILLSMLEQEWEKLRVGKSSVPK